MPTDVVLRTLLILLGFFGVLIGAAYWVRRWVWGNTREGNPRLSIVARLPLPPKALLYALQVGEKVLLLGVTEHSVNLLHEYTLEEWEAIGIAYRSPSRIASKGMLRNLLTRAPGAG